MITINPKHLGLELYSPFCSLRVHACTRPCIWVHIFMCICICLYVVHVDSYIQKCEDVYSVCVCVFVWALCWSWRNVHWKQSGEGEGIMTARLACSAGDPTHHLPPGSPSSENNRIFYTASPSSGLWIGSCPKSKFNKISVRGRPEAYVQMKDTIEC